MISLLPVSAEVYLTYRCPKCGIEHSMRREETEFPGRILCACNEKLVIRPIRQINVQPLYREVASKNFPKAEPPKQVDKLANRDIMNETAAAMMKLGFRKEESKQKILRVVNSGKKFTTTEELLKLVFEGEKNHGE